MKIELRKYYDGVALCKDCKGCSEVEVVKCYIMNRQGFVSDSGIVNKFEKHYTRNGVLHCCGSVLKKDPDNLKKLICEICGRG